MLTAATPRSMRQQFGGRHRSPRSHDPSRSSAGHSERQLGTRIVVALDVGFIGREKLVDVHEHVLEHAHEHESAIGIGPATPR